MKEFSGVKNMSDEAKYQLDIASNKYGISRALSNKNNNIIDVLFENLSFELMNINELSDPRSLLKVCDDYESVTTKLLKQALDDKLKLYDHHKNAYEEIIEFKKTI